MDCDWAQWGAALWGGATGGGGAESGSEGGSRKTGSEQEPIMTLLREARGLSNQTGARKSDCGLIEEDEEQVAAAWGEGLRSRARQSGRVPKAGAKRPIRLVVVGTQERLQLLWPEK